MATTRFGCAAPGETVVNVTDLAIRLRGVVKRFGPITAVDGLDLDVPAGTCVGLLGPNGAGKSTTMRMLTAQAIADEGEIEVLGYRLPGESKLARAECGVVPQLDNLDITLTVEQNLLVFAHLYRVPRGGAPARRSSARSRSPTSPTGATTKVDELSGGMRRRLLIARALVHRPRLLLLDEPTVGLDPQVRQELWALIDRLRSEGVSILMSTHYIEEAERLADTVVIMSHGKAVAEGPPAELVARARRPRGGRGLRPARAPRRGRGRRARSAAQRTRRTGTSVTILGLERQRTAPEGERRPGQPRGRLRAAHRRGDRMMATEATAARPSPRAPGGSAPRAPALAGVLVREVINFARSGARRRSRRSSSRRSTCSRSASASARSSPRSAATTTSSSSAPARSRPRCCSRRSSRRCSGRSSSTSSSAPTTRSSPRRSTPRSSSPPRRCGSPPAPASTAAADGGRASSSASTRRWGMLLVPFIALPRRLRLGVLRDPHRGGR